MNANVSKPLLGLSLAGLAVGFYGIGEALIHRTAATGLGSYVPWGMGVSLYLLFLGLSAGGLLVSCLISFCGMAELKKVSGLATYATLVAEVCAGIAIALDLGHWERMFRFLSSPNLSSPMLWMLIFFTAMLVVYAFKALAIMSGNEAGERAWTIASIPVGFAFYGINGYFFSILTAHPLWSGAVTPVWFVVAALFSGGALVAALAWFSLGEKEATLALARAILPLMALFIFCEWLHVTVGFRSGVPDVAVGLERMLYGRGWTAFWLSHVGLGLALPLGLILFRRSNPAAVAWACVLIVLGFFGFRYAYVVSAQAAPMLPGLEKAWQHPRLALSYAPVAGEWLVTVWVFSLGLLAFALGPRIASGLYGRPTHNG
jgi:dimethyl sulfoxide reductase membrane subunit